MPLENGQQSCRSSTCRILVQECRDCCVDGSGKRRSAPASKRCTGTSFWRGRKDARSCIDEAGRGPLAGPVVVAAVILPLGLFLPHLNDSKKLSAAVREALFSFIMESAVAVEIVSISEKVIDEKNIYQATKQGMHEAVAALRPQPQHVLLDAVPLRLPMSSSAIVHGDAKSASIAAASIAAKVTRDRLMLKYDEEYPQYGFKKHKGYGTAEHLEALRKYGPCPIHRRSFEPIRSMAAEH